MYPPERAAMQNHNGCDYRIDQNDTAVQMGLKCLLCVMLRSHVQACSLQDSMTGVTETELNYSDPKTGRTEMPVLRNTPNENSI